MNEIDKEVKEEQKDDTETTEEQKDVNVIVTNNNNNNNNNNKEEEKEDSSSDNNQSKPKLSKEEKKKEKKEKKERKALRKEIKSNPQFSFIEKDPKQIGETQKKAKKKSKIEDTFNFTKENKYLGSDQSPINSGGEENEHKNKELSPSVKRKTPTVEKSNEDKKKIKKNKEKEEQQLKKKKELLESFLLTHPVVKLRGTTWSYLNINENTSGNEKKESMLFMVGGGIRMESFFEQLNELQKDFRIIAPYVPHELKEFDDYIAGINLILSHHKIKKVHLYGISFGGMICQYFLFKHPEKVLSVIFSHVSPPNPDFGSLCSKFQIKKYERAPSALRKCLLGLNVKEKDFKRDIPHVSDEVIHFWIKRIKRFSAQEEDLLSRINALSDYNTNVSYTPSNFEKIDVPILIIDSERTEDFGKTSYLEMQKLFPKAQSHFLEGYGHLQIIVNQESISQVIGKWYLKNYWDKGRGL